MRKRSRAREFVLKVLYRIDISKESYQYVLKDVLGRVKDKEVFKFAKEILDGTVQNKEQIDILIKKHALNWELERMAVIDRNILRFATYELLFSQDIPPKVTINEAIELAKKFGDHDSGRFVNGILDNIVRLECPQKMTSLNES